MALDPKPVSLSAAQTAGIHPIVVDAPTRRGFVREKTVKGLEGLFPLVGRTHELHVTDIKVKPASYSSNDQKTAILHGRTLAEPVVGTLVLKEKATGKVVDTKKNHILAHMPYFTERHTFIVGGNEYELPNQLRLKSGVYTRERGNGEYEAAFNLSKGENFRLSMDPASGKMSAEFGTTTLPLAPMLKHLGVQDTQLKQAWGEDLFHANAATRKTTEETVLNKLVARVKRPKEATPATLEAKKDFLHKYFESTQMDPSVTARTLGKAYDRVTPQAILDASTKLLDVHRGKATEDDRDSLEFKHIRSSDDFFQERLEKDAKRSLAPKLVWKMDKAKTGKIKDFVPNSAFTRSLNSFLTNSAIAAVPTQYNPMEIIDHASKITSLGEGGIESDRAIPFESRKIHGTHLGVLDPVRTPECYDAQTEVLTARGWVSWAAVTESDEFACREGARLVFRRAETLFAAPYTGEMYGVRTPYLDILVTPNHRVWSRPNGKTGPDAWQIRAAQEIHGQVRSYDTGHAPFIGGDLTEYCLPRVAGKGVENRGAIPAEDWAEFLGWYLSEGCFRYDEENRLYATKIAQSKSANPEKCARIEALLRRLPFTWRMETSGTEYCLSGKQLAAYVSQFGKSQDKFLPEYVFRMPYSARLRMYEALMLGDGSNSANSRSRMFYSTSRALADGMVRLCASLGLPSRVGRMRRAKAHYLPLYRVAIFAWRERAARPQRGHYYTQQYDGMVYCATVPGGLLYVRRNGSVPVWSGNSGHAGIDIRAAMGGHRDANGNLYGRFINAKTGQPEVVPVTTLAKSVIGHAGQHDTKDKMVDALHGSDNVRVERGKVDYFVENPTHMFSPSTALVPFLNGIQGNRAIMGSKFQVQALPLLERDVPFVMTAAPRGTAMTQEMARMTVPTAHVHGTVAKVDKDFIYIRPDATKKASEGGVEDEELEVKLADYSMDDLEDEPEMQVPEHLIEDAKTAAAKKPADNLIKLPYDSHFPLAAKTYLHNTVTVKPGDKVAPGQQLANSNFTKDGHIALGKNMSVAYLAYYGKNSNDAVVISEGAANKLTSEHMYKETLRKGPDTIMGKDKYRAYYGMRFTAAQLDKLDDNGVAKPGKTFEPGDPVILALDKATPSPDAALLGALHKSLVKPYRDAAVVWEHHTPGTVIDAVNAARQAVVTVRTQEQMKVGDKLANRFGGKGVVSEIIPDHKMVQDEKGKPIDVLFTSAGIVSRINPAQVVEGALGKVVEKTGKPIVMPQFADGNNVDFAKKLLAKHGIKDKETVLDPVSGRSIPGVFVGRSYIHKLFKSTETNYAARGVTSYDVNLQPTKGGEEGAKGLGKMEINTFLAHNARNTLKDALTVKSEKSDDYWRAMEFGLPPPPPKSPFVTEKLTSMLKGAGINVDKRGTTVGLHALTDDHVKRMSSGALTLPTLEKSTSFMVTAKDLKPEKGGLFDPVLTGGMSGNKWAHIDLPEPTLNPIFEDPARRLLGYTKQELRQHLADHGGDGLRKTLNAIDLDKKERELMARTNTARGADLDDAVKQLKYIRALKQNGHNKAGDAYTLSKVPVIPPLMRPILPSQKSGELQISDANYLYRDLALAASSLNSTKQVGLPSLTAGARLHMYDAQAALAGVADPVSPQLQGRGVKGFVATITGQGSPKSGFLFKKVLKRQQDMSGRATATPDNTLDMDQVGVPEDMLWVTYEKFLMKGLIGQGYNAIKAKEMIEQRHPAARAVLDRELGHRPVFINRAPSLHKHNMVAAFAVPVQGKSLRINPFMEKGMNLDYDGDTMQLHVPVSHGAVKEAQGLTLSKLLFSDKHRDDLMIFPQHEAIIGTYLATAKGPVGPKKKFKTKADAIAAYKRGEITLQTPVEIGP